MNINTAGTRESAYRLGWVCLNCRFKALSLERQCSEIALWRGIIRSKHLISSEIKLGTSWNWIRLRGLCHPPSYKVATFIIRVLSMQELLCYNKEIVCLLVIFLSDTDREKMKCSLVICYNSVRQISVALTKKIPQKKSTLAEFGQFSYGQTCWGAFVFSSV